MNLPLIFLYLFIECVFARAAAAMVGARRNRGSFIITSSPLSGSRKKLPLMPCTAGGAPVTIDRLFGLVKLGTTQSARRSAPCSKVRVRYGIAPSAIACSMYAGSEPSMQTTTRGRSGHA